MSSFTIQIITLAAETVKETGDGPLIPLNTLWVLIVVVLAYFMMRMTMRKIARNQKKYEMPLAQRMNINTKPRETLEQMNELMAALADLSRQINGQIDTRLARLEILLDRADKTIKQLDKSANCDSAPRPKLQSQDLDTAAGTLKEATEKIQPPTQLSPQAREVLEMAEKGFTTIAIAQELNRPVGEIELILSITKRDQEQNGQNQSS